MMKKGTAADKHFDESGVKLLTRSKDPVTKDFIIKPISVSHYPIKTIE